jgi:hypothetical protein
VARRVLGKESHRPGRLGSGGAAGSTSALFARLISHQPAVLFSHNKPATSNQPAVLFSQNKPAPAISHQPTEQVSPSIITSAPSFARPVDGRRAASHHRGSRSSTAPPPRAIEILCSYLPAVESLTCGPTCRG